MRLPTAEEGRWKKCLKDEKKNQQKRGGAGSGGIAAPWVLLQVLLLPPPQALGEATRLRTPKQQQQEPGFALRRKELAWKEAAEKGSVLPGPSADTGFELEEGLGNFGGVP